jgi:hypothetical protein
LPARCVFAYAVACLEHEAAELAAAIDLALVPVEAFSGGCAVRKRLQREIRRLSGQSLAPVVTAVEQAAIAEVEREIAREFPFYLEASRLNEMHDALGMLRLGGPCIEDPSEGGKG